VSVQEAWDGLGKLLWWKQRASSQGEFGLKPEKAAALGLALESYDLGVKAAFAWHADPTFAWIEQHRAFIERLAQGEPAANDTPQAPHVLAPTPGVGEAARD